MYCIVPKMQLYLQPEIGYCNRHRYYLRVMDIKYSLKKQLVNIICSNNNLITNSLIY